MSYPRRSEGARLRPLHRPMLSTLLAVLLFAVGTGAATAQNERAGDERRPILPVPPDRAGPVIFFIGDSTVRNGRGDGANGQWGWADRISVHFDTARIAVVNRALGGRSSRTYITQRYWAETLPLIRSGDFVVIQFGHNDQSPVNDTLRARGTLPGVGEESEAIHNLLTGEPETVHSFGWYLRRYVADIRERGATPILVSLVPRNRWEGDSVVRERDGHAGWTRRVAEETGTHFLDLNELVAREYERLGYDAVQELFEGDNTHTSLAGAELNARSAVIGLRSLPERPLDRYLSGEGMRVGGPDPRQP